MLYSRPNLEVHGAASTIKGDRGLTGVRFEPDGTTVAGNGSVLVAVGPTDEEHVRWPAEVVPQTVPGVGGMVLPVRAVQKALRNLSRDKRLALQHVALSRVRDVSRVGLTTVDPSGDVTTVSTRPLADPYPDWKETLQGVAGGVRVCVNRRDLLGMLKVLDAACPDTGGVAPLFLEVGGAGGGVVARTAVPGTGQRIVGACGAYDTRGEWLGKDEWERGVFGRQRPQRRAQ